LPAFYGLGIIIMFANAQSRRLGDLAAGTLVVRDQADLTLEEVTAVAQPQLTLDIPDYIVTQVASWPIERLSEADINLVEDYLQRRADLANAPQLAEKILQRLMARMDIANEPITIQSRPLLLAQIRQVYRGDE
jgi:hypothetical protein